MDFLPDNLQGWMSFLVQLMGTVWAVHLWAVRSIRQPLKEDMDRRFTHHGERLGALEAACASNAALSQSHDRLLERLHLEHTAQREQQGRHDQRMEDLMARLERHDRERLDEDRAIGEKLARLDERMNIMAPLAQALITLARRGGERGES
jgi:hypothetical protein